MTFKVAWLLIAVACASGACSSSSDDDNGGGSGEFSFLAKAFYSFGIDLVGAEVPDDDSTYEESIEFDDDGNLVMQGGSSVPDGGAALSATDADFIFELSGDEIDAGPAYVLVDSLADANVLIFIQYGLNEPNDFLDLNTFIAGDAPDPFPPSTAFDATTLGTDYTGTGFTLNADGTLNEIFAGDEIALNIDSGTEITIGSGSVFAGMSVSSDTGMALATSYANLAAHGYFLDLGDMVTSGGAFELVSAVPTPDGAGIAFAACMTVASHCSDGIVIQDITGYYFSFVTQ